MLRSGRLPSLGAPCTPPPIPNSRSPGGPSVHHRTPQPSPLKTKFELYISALGLPSCGAQYRSLLSESTEFLWSLLEAELAEYKEAITINLYAFLSLPTFKTLNYVQFYAGHYTLMSSQAFLTP